VKKSVKPPENIAIRTTAELAHYVGLSRATVSRVLNGHSGVKAKNIKRVMEVVERTGFTPDPYSNILRGKRSATIAVYLSSFKQQPVVQKLAEVVQRLAKVGYTALIETAENTNHAEVTRWIKRMRAEGVIFVGQHVDPLLSAQVRELALAGIPHVFTDNFDDRKVNVVTLDRAMGLELAGHHLLDLGHRHIGLMGIDGKTPVELARVAGVRHALEARGLDPAQAIVTLENPPPRDSNMAYGRECARRFRAAPTMPTAFVTLNDEIAFGAMEGFRALGLQVPRDVSIIGFNNQDIAASASPGITTIDAEIEATAAAAVDYLLSQLLKGAVKSGRKQLIPSRLVIRESTGPARA
jgi:LacI family transcriptional regulator, galactose operon repressor